MEPAASSFLVAQRPPSPKSAADLGQAQDQHPAAQPGSALLKALCLLLAVFSVCFLLAGGIAWGLHRAGYDVGFAFTTTYALVALCFCLWKLQLLRRDPASAAHERRRVGFAACFVSLALVSSVALRVVSVKPSLARAPKVALWVLAGLSMVLALCFLVAVLRARSGAEDAGRSPEKDLHELSPEQRV